MTKLIKIKNQKPKNVLNLFLNFLTNHNLVPTFNSFQLFKKTNFNNLSDFDFENCEDVINNFIVSHLETQSLLKIYDNKTAIYLLENNKNNIFQIGNLTIKFFYD